MANPSELIKNKKQKKNCSNQSQKYALKFSLQVNLLFFH